MNKFFSGRSQTTFTRHSALDNGTYVSFKDLNNDTSRIPPMAIVVSIALIAFGVFCMRVLSVWGY